MKESTNYEQIKIKVIKSEDCLDSLDELDVMIECKSEPIEDIIDKMLSQYQL